MLEAAYTHLKKTIGDDGLTAQALTYLGWLNLRQGADALALVQLRQAYRDELASAGADHPMTLRARACLDLAKIATGHTSDGLADLETAVAQYQRVLGTGAPETQLFHYYLMRSALAAGERVPVSVQDVRALSVEALSQGAPWANWPHRLAALRVSLAAVKPQTQQL